MRRDAENIEKLNEMDWRALVIWECNLADPVNLGEMVQSFLEGKNGA
jgi:G:T-mismatch repair DNA endonuclease (very short patch repair protein)